MECHHLDTGYWGDLSLDGKRYFVVAGLRVQHEDKVILVPFFILVENKTGLVVSQEVFQLIDYIAPCKQLQAFHRVLHILSDQGTELVNQDYSPLLSLPLHLLLCCEPFFERKTLVQPMKMSGVGAGGSQK